MRIAIVDDSRPDANRLEEFLSRYQAEGGVDCTSRHFPSAKEFLESDIDLFDLVIMDIDMPGLNGVDAARKLREAGSDVVLMFVTNMPQYALCGYEVEAVDYVLKPVSYPDFALKLQKAGRYVHRNRDQQLAIYTTGGLISLRSSEILYVESALHYLIYHTAGGDYKVRGSMAQAEKELLPLRFSKCNSGFLVNLRHVKSIEKDEVLLGDVSLKISRGRRLEFLNAVTRYLGGMKL